MVIGGHSVFVVELEPEHSAVVTGGRQIRLLVIQPSPTDLAELS